MLAQQLINRLVAKTGTGEELLNDPAVRDMYLGEMAV